MSAIFKFMFERLTDPLGLPINALYEYIIDRCRKTVPVVEKGSFGAHMAVELLNDGPFTIVLDSDRL